MDVQTADNRSADRQRRELGQKHQPRTMRTVQVGKPSVLKTGGQSIEARVSRADEEVITSRVRQAETEALNQTRAKLATQMKQIRADTDAMRWPLRDPRVATRQARRDLNQAYDLLGKVHKALAPTQQ